MSDALKITFQAWKDILAPIGSGILEKPELLTTLCRFWLTISTY